MLFKIRDSWIYPLASFVNPVGQLILIPLLIAYIGIVNYGEYTFLIDLAPLGALFLFLGSERIYFRMARTLSFGQLNTLALVIFSINVIILFGINTVFNFLGLEEVILLILVIFRVAIRGVYLYAESSFRYLIQEVFYITITLTVVYIMRKYLSYITLLQIMIVANSATIIFQFITAKNLIILERINWPATELAMKYALGLITVAFLGWILTYLDRYLIDYSSHNPNLVGEMGLAKKAATTYKLLVAGIEMYFMKKLFLAGADSKENMKLWINSRIFILMSVFVIILIIITSCLMYWYSHFNFRFIIIYLLNIALLAAYQPLNAFYTEKGNISKMLMFLSLSSSIYIILAILLPSVYNLAYANFGLSLSLIIFYYKHRFNIGIGKYHYICSFSLLCSVISFANVL
jgi:hypothetical protein